MTAAQITQYAFAALLVCAYLAARYLGVDHAEFLGVFGAWLAPSPRTLAIKGGTRA